MSQDMWETAGDCAFILIAVFSLTFTVLYLLLTPWWRTETSRNIMAMMGSLAAIGLYGSYVYLVNDRPFLFYQIRFALFMTLSLVILWRIIIFVRVQLIARHAAQREKANDLRS